MKTKLLILLIVFFGLATSCNNDDDNGPTNEITIAGTWDLRNISGGIAGVDSNFEADLIQWSFNEETSVLTIANDHSNDETLYDGLESGTYIYELTVSEGENQINIDGASFGTYTISENELVIAQTLADGYVFSFKR